MRIQPSIFLFFWLAAGVYKDVHDRWQPSKKRSINRISKTPIHRNGNQPKMWRKNADSAEYFFLSFWLAAWVYKDVHDRWQPSKKRSINRISKTPIHRNGNQPK